MLSAFRKSYAVGAAEVCALNISGDKPRLRLTDVDVMRLAGEDVKIPFHYLPEFAQRPLARIRELHVYGSLKMVTKAHATTGTNSQHTGVVIDLFRALFL